ncbi:MAG TPA: DUF456 domain-containing protein [Ohtaekwangia sp.]|nr:DUF456 domain-containing protein [Ohtaekwangia sp.]
MDILWLVIAILLMIAGLIGCLLPFLPGPPLSYIGLLVMQLRSDAPFATKFLWIWAAITVVVTVLDYVIPLYGTKRFGGTRYGIWGCTIGLVVGIFVPPWGLIIGPFIGAFIGEVIGNTNSDHALKAAFGSFIGFLFGTLLKLIASVIMFYYLVTAL